MSEIREQLSCVFWLRISHKSTSKISDKVGLEAPHPRWFTHMAGKLLVAAGKRPQRYHPLHRVRESSLSTVVVGVPPSD